MATYIFMILSFKLHYTRCRIFMKKFQKIQNRVSSNKNKDYRKPYVSL